MINEFYSNSRKEILEMIFNQALITKNENALIAIMTNILKNYNYENEYLVNVLFFPSLNELTKLHNTKWIHNVWFSREYQEIIKTINDENLTSILTNLLILQRINSEAEYILLPIAKRKPEKVIDFFGKRLNQQRNKQPDTVYEWTPYQFYYLPEPLTHIASYILESILKWNKGYADHKYETIRIVKAIFPKIAPALEQELNKLIQSENDQKLAIVISILQYYGGEIETYTLCKEIVKVLAEDSKHLAEVNIVIINTGLVAAEFGLMKAYENKKNIIKDWSNDSNLKVRKFSTSLVELLEKMILAEKKRVEENIELEKHRYRSE